MNRRLFLCFPKAALYQTELRPEGQPVVPPIVSTDRVTRGTDEIAFRDLREDRRLAVIANPAADLAKLDRAGPMIPMHGFGREEPSAVSAWLSALQFPQPAVPLEFPGGFVVRPPRFRLEVVIVVIRFHAGLAPDLVSIAAFEPVKL